MVKLGPVRLIMTPQPRERPHTWPGRRGSCSTTLQKPKGAPWVHSPRKLARVQWRFKISVYTPLIWTPADQLSLSQPPSRLGGLLFCCEFVRAKPSGVCMRLVAVRTCHGGVGFGIVGPSLWLSLHPERRWSACSAKNSRNHPNIPNGVPSWESQPISPLDH